MKQTEKIKAEIERLKYTGYAYNRGAYEAICTIEDFINSLPQEEVGENLEEYEKEYLEKWKDEIISVYDRHAGLVDGAQWQKEQMIAKAVDGEVGYWNIRGLSINMELPSELEEGDKVKLIIAKED